MKRKMMDTLGKLFFDEQAQGMVEYGLILALIAAVVIAALTLMGTNISTLYDTINLSL